MLAVVNYGVGNLFSLKSALQFLGFKAIVTSNAEEILNADRIILPGVGAFADAANKLRESGLDKAVAAAAQIGTPLLGICLGMQLLFDESHEYGIHKGLGRIKGNILPLEAAITDKALKIPQIGWNSLQIKQNDEIFKYIQNGDSVYFVHSYYAAQCEDATLAVTDYSCPVTAVVKNKNVYGMQFHPEKSGKSGLALLRAFSEVKKL